MIHTPISVVIPLRAAELAHHGLLPQLAALPNGSEIVLVQATLAGDDVPQNPASHLYDGMNLRLRTITSPPGRARQLNAGVAGAVNDWLWLLHADSRLYPSTMPALDRHTAGYPDQIGYFDLRFADDGPAWVRLNQWGAWLRSRWLGLPFGDQGLVMRRQLFEHLGGFDESAAYGEDHLIIWQAHHQGVRLRPLKAPLQTSARKYAEQGWLGTSLGHIAATWNQARQARKQQSKPR